MMKIDSTFGASVELVPGGTAQIALVDNSTGAVINGTSLKTYGKKPREFRSMPSSASNRLASCMDLNPLGFLPQGFKEVGNGVSNTTT